MLRTPIALGLIAAGSVSLSTGVEAKCSGSRQDAACQMQQTSAFVRERNAEIETSMAAYNADRAFARARNKEIEASIARSEAWRTKEFTRARNAEITASLSRVSAERAFAQARNREIEKSFAAAETRRMREFARARNAEIEVSLAAYTAERALVAFAAARNAEAAQVVAAVERVRTREFARARNAEIDVALAAYRSDRALAAFAKARNAEAEKSIAAYEARRTQQFAQARNKEIELSVASYVADRQGSIITGSIRKVETPSAGTPCHATDSGVGAMNFAPSTSHLLDGSKPALDKLAALAKACPTMHIEIHGHTDATGSPKANKRLSERRARSVAAYLIAVGVDARRVHSIGHGSTMPVASNESSVSRAQNRRIEFNLTDRAPGPALSAILR